MQRLLLLSGTLLLTVSGQLVIKSRALAIQQSSASPSGVAYLVAMFADRVVWLGLSGAALAAVCWIMTLRQLSVSAAYPFMALSFVIVPACALVFLGERVTTLQWLGCGVIVAGVAITALGTPS